MKKLSLLCAAIFSIMAVNAKVVYCKVEQGWWKTDGATVGVYTFGESATVGTTWPGVRMTPVEGKTDLWSAEIGEPASLIFTRYAANDNDANKDWGAQTANLAFPAGEENLYTITSTEATWGNATPVSGEWSIYPEPAEETGITYDLQGGVTNEWGWTTPQEMYNAITAIADAVRGSGRVWLTVEELHTASTGNTFAGGTYYGAADQPTKWQAFQDNEDLQKQFSWLLEYIAAKTNTAVDFASFRNNVTGFFGNRIWASGFDFSECGVSTYAAYAEYWKAAFANPTEVTEEFTLNVPYKESVEFLGWFNNADGDGEAITTIDATTTGTLYAVWKSGETTALDNATLDNADVRKVMENGQLIIIRNGVRYNAMGTIIR